MTARAQRSTCCQMPMSAARTSFMPVTGWILRLIILFWLTGARERATSIHDETRAFPIAGAGGNFARLAVDFDGDAGRIAEHHAQRTPTTHGLHATRARHVVEQLLALRVVDLDPAVIRQVEFQSRFTDGRLFLLRLRGGRTFDRRRRGHLV